jgi:hypothetical protein
MTKDEFLKWEYHSRDTIDFKRIYADITRDVVAGLLLSQLMFWHIPDKHGKTRMRVEEEGELWVRKKREDWWNECRLSPKQFDRASALLSKKGFAIIKNFKHLGRNTKHIRLNIDNIIKAINDISTGSDTTLMGKCAYPKGEVTVSQWGSDGPQMGKGAQAQEPEQAKDSGNKNLQTTSENTTETTTCKAGNVEQNSFVEKAQHVEQNVNCNPCTAVCNSSVNQCSVSLGKEVVGNFAGGPVFEILQRRQPGFKKHDKTVGDINKFKDRLYRKKRQYSSAEYTEALKIYNAMPDDNQHKINMTDYINHESQKWDFSKTNNKDVVVARFILEYIFWHPIYQHFQVIKRNNELDVDIANYKKRHKKLKKDTIPDDIKEEDMEKAWGEMATA